MDRAVLGFLDERNYERPIFLSARPASFAPREYGFVRGTAGSFQSKRSRSKKRLAFGSKESMCVDVRER